MIASKSIVVHQSKSHVFENPQNNDYFVHYSVEKLGPLKFDDKTAGEEFKLSQEEIKKLTKFTEQSASYEEEFPLVIEEKSENLNRYVPLVKDSSFYFNNRIRHPSVQVSILLEFPADDRYTALKQALFVAFNQKAFGAKTFYELETQLRSTAMVVSLQVFDLQYFK